MDHRDHAIERLLKRSGTAPEGAEPGGCPDAGMLAAWIDGSLTPTESAALDAHASSCRRCQAVSAAVVRATPRPGAPVSLWRRWSLGWLVPLTAGATAVMLWVAWPTGDPQMIGEVARDLSDRDRQGARPAPQEGARVASEAPAVPPSVDDRVGATPPAPRGRAAETDLAARAEPLDEAREAPSAAPPAALSVRERTAAPVLVASANPAIQWRVDEPGVVRHTRDGGATWEESTTGVTAELTAGASPFPPVCWLVGRAGTILLTTDGLEWQRVPFPETTDLVAVQALDAGIAAVTTDDGRTFRTTDRGASWN